MVYLKQTKKIEALKTLPRKRKLKISYEVDVKIKFSLAYAPLILTNFSLYLTITKNKKSFALV